MVARAVTKKITDLPLYSLNTNQGNILYSEGGVSYQYPMSGIVKKSFTFAVGGTLWSNTDRISDGTYLYYWTGVYPVTVTAGSTVDTLGGVGIGFWAPDTDSILRASLAATTGASLIGGLGYVTPQMFGGVADGVADNTASIAAAAQSAISRNLKLVFPSGTYVSSDVEINVPINIEISSGAYLNFAIILRGDYFSKKNLVQTTLPWASVPVGTTSIAGNFSTFSTGSIVGIKLNDVNGGSASNGNEAGVDFSAITSASANSIILTTPTRLAYQMPDIVELSSAINYSGTLTADSYTIPGNYTSLFSEGDIIRIENLSGTYGVEAKTYYFEYAKIMSINASAITLKCRLFYTHTNPWIVKTGFIKQSIISGKGRVKRLEIRQCDTPIVTGIDIDRLIVSNAYDSFVSDVNCRGVGEPSTANHSYCYGRSKVNNLRVGGSIATTDNAACKFMSCPGIQITNISSDNTTATGSQGDYGFYMDALYTPYYCWNKSVQIDTVTAEKPRSSVNRGIWVYGLLASSVRNVIGAQTFLQGCVDTVFDGIVTPNEPIEIRDLIRCSVKGLWNSITWLGCHYSSLDGVTKGLGSGSSAGIALRAGAGTTNPEDGTAYTLGLYNRFDLMSNTTIANAITMSIGNQSYPLFGSKCRDLLNAGTLTSITFGSNITAPRMEGNFLQGTIPQSSSWTGVRMKGGFNLDGIYSDGHIKWNGWYIWMSTDGHLRANAVVPTSDNPAGTITIGPAS